MNTVPRLFAIATFLVALIGMAVAQNEPTPAVEPPSTPDLVRTLIDGDEEASTDAARELVARGKDAVPALRAALDKSRKRSLAVMAVLADIEGAQQDASIPPLWVRDALDRAQASYQSGDLADARRLAEALLALAPPGSWKTEAENLAQRAADEAPASARFRVRWEPSSHLVVQPGQLQVSPMLVLENAGAERVTLRIGAASAASGAALPFGHLAVSQGLYVLDGKVHSRMATQVLRAPSSLDLAPGQSWRAPIALDLVAPEKDQVYRLSARGRLRPVDWTVGKAVEGGAIRIPPLSIVVVGELVALPAAGASAASALATTLDNAGRAEDREAAARLVFAQALALGPDEEAAGVDSLITGLDAARGPVRRAVLSALPVLTGRPPDDSPDAWILWWMSRR